MRRLLVPVVIFAALAAALPASASADGRGVVTRNGRIGPLHVGVSSKADVRAFAGRPAESGFGEGEGGVALSWLRFRCGSSCNTYFYFDGRGRLANFITRSARYRTANDTRVGDDRYTAEELEGKSAQPYPCGADSDVIERVGRAWLYVAFNPSGSRVEALTVAGSNSVLGC